jgi:hypothetical protein
MAAISGAFPSLLKAVAGGKAEVETERVIRAYVQSTVCGNDQVSNFFVVQEGIPLQTRVCKGNILCL